MINNLCNVFTFVKDQEKSKEFWCNKLGFMVRTESPMGKFKWIEVAPNMDGTSIVLYPESLHDNPHKYESTITFFTNDIKSTYNELSSKGVKFKKEPHDTGYGIFAEFYDEDGNVFSLKQV